MKKEDWKREKHTAEESGSLSSNKKSAPVLQNQRHPFESNYVMQLLSVSTSGEEEDRISH